MDNQYDVIIVGGACAGLTAGLYASRRALKTLIITKDIGGQAAITSLVNNYPGEESIPGFELMNKFKAQAEKAGSRILISEVQEIARLNQGFRVITAGGEYAGAALILSFGLERRKLNVPGEKEFTGKGVSYCATCDAPFFKNKIVGIVGAGNSAFDSVNYLSKIAKEVYVFVRSDKFRAEQALIDVVEKTGNVKILTFTEVKEIIGDAVVQKVKLINNQTNEESAMELDGLFVEIGWIPQSELVKDLVQLNERGYVIVDNEAKTSTPGVFAAGDISNTPFKQIVISAGEGAKAALSAARYIQEHGTWDHITRP